MNLTNKHVLAFSAVLTATSPFIFEVKTPVLANPTPTTAVVASNRTTADATISETPATLLSYPYEERTATTLYINKLPVLTFLNSGNNADPDVMAQREADLFGLAQQVSQYFNQLTTQADFDAAKLSVNWLQGNEYALLYGSTQIVKLNGEVFLADTTDHAEQDALIAVNRLRRLLGNVSPLEAIANKPSPKMRSNAATASNKVVGTLQGRASWYGPGFHGRRTASGERFDQYALTAAHKTLPFGTQVRVTNVNNGRSVVVRINDRGPYAHGRVIDLSKGSAQQIGLVGSGVGTVKLEVLGN